MNYKKMLTGGVGLLLLVNVAFMLGYIFIWYQNYFHSDSAAKVLLAKEIFDTGYFFPSDWNYVNSDLFVLFGHVFIIPLLPFIPAGFTAHAVSGAIFAGLILWGVWLVSSIGNIPLWQRLAAVALIASGISGFMSENLYGQVSYGAVFFFCLYIVYFSDKILITQDKWRIFWSILLVIILALAYWANPKRAFVTYGLPLFLALGWMAFINNKKDGHRYLLLIIVALLGSVIGSLLHIQTIKEVNNHLGAGNARWLPVEGVLTNIGLTLKGLFAQLGGLLPANTSLFTLGGLYAGFRFVVATTALIVIPISLKRTMDQGTDRMRLFALFAIFAFGLLMFMYITTTIPDMSDPIQSSRYLVPGVLLGILIMTMNPVQWAHQPSLFTMGMVLVTFTFVTSGYHTYRLSTINSQHLGQPLKINTDRLEMVDFLRKNNLKYGYASYWNAGSLTVLSDGEVKIRQIVLNNGMPTPMRHLSSNRWYRQSAWKGKSFLMLHKSEIPHLDVGKLERLRLQPIEKLNYKNFSIYVFPENIATKLPGWDTRYEEPAVFLANADTPSQTGRLIEANGTKVLIAEKGETGALHFGPYVNVEPGRYRVTFDVSTPYNQAGTVRLDVAAAPDQKIFGEISLTESNKSQVIDFTLDELRTMEFRVWALGSEMVSFRSVSIHRLQDYLQK
ncbi:hypothetical protein [Limnohabitans sp.]|uniref:hypothetical protein n=1 Tax=Limnohabitans sp. TaxID=1907725 RepID=UPI0031FDA43F